MGTHILIADDDEAIRQLLELILQEHDYTVRSAHNGDQLVRMAQEMPPDLILVDLMMPVLDGFEAIRQLRNDTRTAHIPMLILTARTNPSDLVIGFESGADDYISKPFKESELLARIKGHLRRAAQQPVRNPLTGLAGNVLLTEELKYRLKRNEQFAYLYVDLDNFKAFNDIYGPARGDRVIKLVAEVLQEVVRDHGSGTDFIGHIGGDDFTLLTSPEYVDVLCKSVIERFDQRVPSLYDQADRERGYLQSTDRQGMPRRFPIISVSIGGVTTRNRSFADHEEISRVAADMKQYAKQQPNSRYAIDTRARRDTPVPEERRGKHLPMVLVVSAESTLRLQLRDALQHANYRSMEAPSILAAHALLARDFPLALAVIDARLEGPSSELAESLRARQPSVPLIILGTNLANEQAAFRHGTRAYFQIPFQMQQFLICVGQFARLGE